MTNQIDSASFYLKKSHEFQQKGKYAGAYMENLLGELESKRKDYEQVLGHYRAAVPIAIRNKNYLDIVYTYNGIAQVYQETGNIDSSIY